MRFFKIFFLFTIAAGFLFSLTNCRKEAFTDKGVLNFSTDTLTFDTVFTSIGSATRSVKIYNREKKAVMISSIKLMGIPGTQFRINVDGVVGRDFAEVEIPANDSIYVFAEVTVNPNDQNAPFVIIDDLVFTCNGKVQTLTLQAWGQNAYYHYGQVYRTTANGGFSNDTTWYRNKPHIIVANDSFPGVGVDEGYTLNIEPGTRIYAANNSGLFVYGKLNAQASNWNDSIVFQGMRLESFYANKPAQWWGIIFGRNTSIRPELNLRKVIVNESYFGVADAYIFNIAFQSNVFNINLAQYSNSTAPILNMEQCIVKNNQNTCLFALNAEITADNCIFHTSGSNVVALAMGGDYNFTHCNIYNTGGRYLEHKQEALLVADKILGIDEVLYNGNFSNAKFLNTVVYGGLENEFRFVDDADKIRFDHCLLKLQQDTVSKYPSRFDVASLFNQDPKFKAPDTDNFYTDSLSSPLIDVNTIGLPNDIWDNPRPRRLRYDIGAVERE